MSQIQTFDAGKVTQDLRAAGRNLWLAGLGAVAGAVEADRESRALFDRLVDKGRPVDERRREAAEQWSARTGETFREFRKLLQDTVEYEGKSLMKRLGIATDDDFKALANRLDLLTKNVEELVARWKIEATPPTETIQIQTTAAGTPKRGSRRAAKEA